MRRANYIDCLYDVTVAYSDAIGGWLSPPEEWLYWIGNGIILVQSEFDLVCLGLCPREVHFDVRRIPINQLPEKDEELGIWLKELWREKEEKLRRFYALPREKCRLETTEQLREYKVLSYQSYD